MPTLSLLGAVAVTAVLAVGSVGGATVVGGDRASSTPGAGPRLDQACTRVPMRIARVEKVQARLHADARTRGSLAFLQARIDRAKADGRTDQARLLSDRLAVRKDLDARLPGVLVQLKDAQKVCDARTSGTSW